MKKRTTSQEILDQVRHRRWARSKRKKRRTQFGKWPAIARDYRRFTPKGDCVVVVPDGCGILESPTKWFSAFENLVHPKTKNVKLNFSGLKFAYPEVFVYIAAVVDHLLRKSNASVEETGTKLPKIESYLEICGLRPFFFAGNPANRHQDPRFHGECIPISRDIPEKDSLARKISDLIGTKLNAPGDLPDSLSEALGEVMGNALEHSEVRHWYRLCQVHPSRGLITVAIADNGVGIPFTLKKGHQPKRYEGLSDPEIIKMSFQSDVTKYRPAVGEVHGTGMETILDFALEAQGKIAIASGRGLYMIDYSAGLPVESSVEFKRDLAGTMVVLRIPINKANATI